MAGGSPAVVRRPSFCSSSTVSGSVRSCLPPLPANEVLLFGFVTIAMGGWSVLRDGLYLRGVPILFAGLAFFGWIDPAP
jgi:hypothetical protein